MQNEETIVAPATGAGRGGVGVVRASGPMARLIAQTLLGRCPASHHATYLALKDRQGEVLDQGIALFFQAPHSFTGEDVFEFQGHGSPVLMDLIVQEMLNLPGVRFALPGEFSQRAFINGKLDLVQAEAIADLVAASSAQAARAAVRSLQGMFSEQVNALDQALLTLRIEVEASIDFSEEEVEPSQLTFTLEQTLHQLKTLLQRARWGTRLQEGIEIVLVGAPNAGKSSLFNAMISQDRAIVTPLAGTTRDTLREGVLREGITLYFTDTAGLHPSDDPIEQIGMDRARVALAAADLLLIVIDASAPFDAATLQAWYDTLPSAPQARIFLLNKIDRCLQPPRLTLPEKSYCLSATTGEGLDALWKHLEARFRAELSEEGLFSARRRHLEALQRAREALQEAITLQPELPQSLDRVAEALRLAQAAVGEITGVVCPDDLLGKIFSTFCIGK